MFFSDLILVIQKRSTLFLLFLFWISAIRSGGPLVAGSPYCTQFGQWIPLYLSRLFYPPILLAKLFNFFQRTVIDYQWHSSKQKNLQKVWRWQWSSASSGTEFFELGFDNLAAHLCLIRFAKCWLVQALVYWVWNLQYNTNQNLLFQMALTL